MEERLGEGRWWVRRKSGAAASRRGQRTLSVMESQMLWQVREAV